ncbi:MAG: hypothetical protein ABSG69_06820 [Candidatus Acidiferrum sp.]|jgi:hypothetical protein
MQRRTKLRILLVIAVVLVMPSRRTCAETFAWQNASTASTNTSTLSASDPTVSPTSFASTSGMVWVNLGSRAYYKPRSRYYGKTKRGKYALEDDAMRAGYRGVQKVACAGFRF